MLYTHTRARVIHNEDVPFFFSLFQTHTHSVIIIIISSLRLYTLLLLYERVCARARVGVYTTRRYTTCGAAVCSELEKTRRIHRETTGRRRRPSLIIFTHARLLYGCEYLRPGPDFPSLPTPLRRRVCLPCIVSVKTLVGRA